MSPFEQPYALHWRTEVYSGTNTSNHCHLY